MDKKVKVTKSTSCSKKFGVIITLEFENKSKLYITKKGWTMVTPPKNTTQIKKIIKGIQKNGRVEMTTSWDEVDFAIRETIISSYVNKLK